MDRPRIGIIIPALNESATIAEVVAKARQYGLPIVVDDGSTDATGKVAAEAGASVVRHEINQGYDAALNSGFAFAAREGYEYLITMDADGQHNPGLLTQYIEALTAGADLVAGVRDRRQRLAEDVFAYVGRRLWGLDDPLCGMKGYRLAIYKERGHFDAYRSIGTELAIFAARRRRKVVQIPVLTRDRVGASRFGRVLVGNWRIFRALALAAVNH